MTNDGRRLLEPLRRDTLAVDLQHLRYAVTAADRGSFRWKHSAFGNPRLAAAFASSKLYVYLNKPMIGFPWMETLVSRIIGNTGKAQITVQKR